MPNATHSSKMMRVVQKYCTFASSLHSCHQVSFISQFDRSCRTIVGFIVKDRVHIMYVVVPIIFADKKNCSSITGGWHQRCLLTVFEIKAA